MQVIRHIKNPSAHTRVLGVMESPKYGPQNNCILYYKYYSADLLKLDSIPKKRKKKRRRKRETASAVVA